MEMYLRVRVDGSGQARQDVREWSRSQPGIYWCDEDVEKRSDGYHLLVSGGGDAGEERLSVLVAYAGAVGCRVQVCQEHGVHDFDVAVWLTRFSSWPDLVEEVPVESWHLPYEVMQELLRARGISSAFKVAVNPGYGSVRRWYHVKPDN